MTSFFFDHANIHTTTLITTRIAMSIRFSVTNATGLIAPATPNTRRILKMLEPMTFPNAISTSFFLAATIDVTSSGRLVPSATIVSPIRFWLIPNPVAIVEAPSTTKSPPNLIATAPPIMYTIHWKNFYLFINLFFKFFIKCLVTCIFS